MTRKLSDAEKTDRMAGLLRARFPHPRYAAMWEVGTGTGFNYREPTRYADCLVLNLWPSDGLELHGFEIKASRSDWKREAADLTKHEALARYCHRWTLVTWDTAVVGTDELPEGWGWWTVAPDGTVLEVQRKPGERKPEPWPTSFTAMLVRRAATESPNATFAGASVRAALAQANVHHQRQSSAAVERARENAHLDGWMRARGLEQMPSRWTSHEGRVLWTQWEVAWQQFKSTVVVS